MGVFNKVKDMAGKRYGRLVGVARHGTDKFNRATWVFECDCGNTVIKAGSPVRMGHTKSCGCLLEKVHENNKTHGLSHLRMYHIWNSMEQRCNNPKRKDYDRYGGRGIEICERWEKFENFYEDMRDSYKKHVDEYGEKDTQIDRIDNKGNYESDNCRWVTLIQQHSNKSNNRILEFNGKKKTLNQWSRDMGLKRVTVARRLNAGWGVEKALTTEVDS